MLKVKSLVNIGMGILLMLVISFSLLPCSAKEVLAGNLNVEYFKPLHKTQATITQHVNCSNSFESVIVNNVSSSTKISFGNFNKDFLRVQLNSDLLNDELPPTDYPHYVRGNFPPKYILYKRFKIGLV